MNTVYIIFDCDQWKSIESMRFICVCTEDRLVDTLLNIKSDHEYTDDDMNTYIHIEKTVLNELPY